MSTYNKGKDDKQIEETKTETETAVSIDDGSTRRMLLMNSNSPMQNATNTITQPQPQTETQQTQAQKEATQRIMNEVTNNQTQQKKEETDDTNTDADTRIDKVTGLSISVLNNLHKFLTHKTNAEKMKKKSQHQAHDVYNPQYHFNPHYQQQQQHLHRSLPYTGMISNASNNTPTPLQSVTQQTRAQNKVGVSGGGGSESSLFGGRYHDSMISPLERKLGYTFREILEATNGE